jgi:hypothetical protein
MRAARRFLAGAPYTETCSGWQLCHTARALTHGICCSVAHNTQTCPTLQQYGVHPPIKQVRLTITRPLGSPKSAITLAGSTLRFKLTRPVAAGNTRLYACLQVAWLVPCPTGLASCGRQSCCMHTSLTSPCTRNACVTAISISRVQGSPRLRLAEIDW